MLGKTNAEGLRAAYIYDWYAREIFRVGDPEDADRIFHNALLGMPPGFDLARASALKQMDQGHDEELMRAFAHTYTDREGGLYAGVTLYDVWRSGLDMEMPDVDTLGIVHTVLDDWESWTDPVPGTQHRSLFGAIGKLFGKARHYREPRESAVDCLLLADPIPRKDYESLHGNFHALWAHHDSDIAMVATDFPDAEGWLRYVKKWVDTCKSQTVWDKGLARKKQFDESDRALRGALIEALRDVRALE